MTSTPLRHASAPVRRSRWLARALFGVGVAAAGVAFGTGTAGAETTPPLPVPGVSVTITLPADAPPVLERVERTVAAATEQVGTLTEEVLAPVEALPEPQELLAPVVDLARGAVPTITPLPSITPTLPPPPALPVPPVPSIEPAPGVATTPALPDIAAPAPDTVPVAPAPVAAAASTPSADGWEPPTEHLGTDEPVESSAAAEQPSPAGPSLPPTIPAGPVPAPSTTAAPRTGPDLGPSDGVLAYTQRHDSPLWATTAVHDARATSLAAERPPIAPD